MLACNLDHATIVPAFRVIPRTTWFESEAEQSYKRHGPVTAFHPEMPQEMSTCYPMITKMGCGDECCGQLPSNLPIEL